MKASLISRRSLLVGGIGAVALLGLGGGARFAWGGGRQLLRPPGGQDEEHFLSTCIRCDRCRQVCPMNVIESSDIEDGLINIRTPKLNFRNAALQRTLGTTEYHQSDTGYCSFCDSGQQGGQVKKCIANCPTGALRDFDETQERLGVAKIDPVYCINYPQIGQTPTGCRLCVDACAYEAIVMNGDQRPEVIPDMCNGCGKCELVCPSASYRQMIGASTLREKAEEGAAQYASSLAYYLSTGKIPRGINVHPHDEDSKA